MIESSLVDYKFIQYSPSNIAASAIYIVNKINNKLNCWSDLMNAECGLSEAQIRVCAKDVFVLLQNINEYEH